MMSVTAPDLSVSRQIGGRGANREKPVRRCLEAALTLQVPMGTSFDRGNAMLALCIHIVALNNVQ